MPSSKKRSLMHLAGPRIALSKSNLALHGSLLYMYVAVVLGRTPPLGTARRTASPPASLPPSATSSRCSSTSRRCSRFFNKQGHVVPAGAKALNHNLDVSDGDARAHRKGARPRPAAPAFSPMQHAHAPHTRTSHAPALLRLASPRLPLPHPTPPVPAQPHSWRRTSTARLETPSAACAHLLRARGCRRLPVPCSLLYGESGCARVRSLPLATEAERLLLTPGRSSS